MWREDEEYDRLGLEERRFPILDVELPLITVPVRPGTQYGLHHRSGCTKPTSKNMGTNSAAKIQDRLNRELALGRRSTFLGDSVE